MSRSQEPTTVGIAGTGFVARHLALELRHRPEWRLGAVLTRRPRASVTGFPTELLVDSIDALIDRCTVLIECTGDVFWGTEIVERALAAHRPVITYAAELHVTTGSAFVGRGFFSEAEGDQPGSLAALTEEARSMGFEPLVFGNLKGFLDRDPTPDAMAFWAQRLGLSLPMVTAFTDGTKLQIEQCLVGNGLGADIVQDELLGLTGTDLETGARALAREAERVGRPIVDYLLGRHFPHGVFIVARHRPEQHDALRYLKMGDGPYYVLVKPHIFVHLEVFKTLARWRQGGGVLLDNSPCPRLSVAAVAKRRLAAGTRIDNGIGSFALRGVCVRIADWPDHLPIGLARDIVVRRHIDPGQMLTFDDVDLPASRPLALWQQIRARVLAGASSRSAPWS